MYAVTDHVINVQRASRSTAITGTPFAFPVRFLEAKNARSN
ncbi:hypothetical protein [Aeromonas veronii]|nr:hypothetical protein [Aeromonas veronii]MCX0438051.1 hypothetical protein [Aeromonas veronii]